MSEFELGYVPGFGVSENLLLFVRAFEPYVMKSPEGKTKRREAFQRCDSNASGRVSLAESENFILDTLKTTYHKDIADLLFKTFRPSFLYAFNNAKDIDKTLSGGIIGGMKTATEDDYLSFSEFRIYVAYVRIYAGMFEWFAQTDVSEEYNDRRIEFAEFIAAYPSFQGSSFVGLQAIKTEEDAMALFNKIDDNGGGMILFSEWSQYLKKEEIKYRTPMGKLLKAQFEPLPRFSDAGSVASKNTLVSRATQYSTASSVLTPLKTRNQNARYSPKSKIGSPPRFSPTKVSGVYTPGKSSSQDLLAFITVFQPFAEKSTDGLKLRKTYFNNADNNGNGHLSLAEVDLFIQNMLIGKYARDMGKRLHALYRPSYIRAFNATKPIHNSDNAVANDYIQFSEFRILNAYICIYAAMYDAFAKIDGGSEGVDENDDKRIERYEWLKGYRNISEYGFVGFSKITDDKKANAIYDHMDSDGKGMVLLSEFCDYVKKCEMSHQSSLGKLLSGNLKLHKC
jgi:Ca2+-binding EF-hand superfamily protein